MHLYYVNNKAQQVGSKNLIYSNQKKKIYNFLYSLEIISTYMWHEKFENNSNCVEQAEKWMIPYDSQRFCCARLIRGLQVYASNSGFTVLLCHNKQKSNKCPHRPSRDLLSNWY